MWPVALAACLALAVPAAGQEFDGVVANGLLDDETLFRLAVCGVPPGQSCGDRVVRWARPDLTLAVAAAPPQVPAGTVRRIGIAVDQAIAQINGAGADLRIARDDSASSPQIAFVPVALAEGEVGPVPGDAAFRMAGVGFSTIWWEEGNRASHCRILIARDIDAADIRSVVLEEVFQCLGFRFDIEDPAYEGRSILSQTSNATVTIEGQDRMLLRTLYPPRKEVPAP